MKARSTGVPEKNGPPQRKVGTGQSAIKKRVYPVPPPIGRHRVLMAGVPAPPASGGFGPQMRRW
eukprot:713213-Pyramimonas_sp.AAC.1